MSTDGHRKPVGERSTKAGIQCECSAFGMKTIRTVPRSGFVLRRLQCLSCGQRVTTVERPVNKAMPEASAMDSAVWQESIGQMVESVERLKIWFPGVDRSSQH